MGLNFLKNIKINYNVGKKTWFGSGGNCLLFCEAENVEQLKFLFKIVPKKYPLFILGLGSNIIFRDGFYKGVVIKLGKEFKNISHNKEILKVGCGVKDFDLANYCLENSITNFEFLIGIPGTIGGGLRMNSSCYGSCISENLRSIKVLDDKRKILIMKKEDILFNYRENTLPKKFIFLEAEFFIKFKKKNFIKRKMDEIKKMRKKTQPIGVRTGGSTFKNPKNLRAWEIIEKVGLRDKIVGGAKVSNKHSNFIINFQNASSLDLEILGEEIKKVVNEKTGVKLLWEIERIGDFEKF